MFITLAAGTRYSGKIDKGALTFWGSLIIGYQWSVSNVAYTKGLADLLPTKCTENTENQEKGYQDQKYTCKSLMDSAASATA